MNGLVQSLRALEQVRAEQVSALELLNAAPPTLDGASYGQAASLARQEQRAAAAALDAVERLLSEGESEQAHKRRRSGLERGDSLDRQRQRQRRRRQSATAERGDSLDRQRRPAAERGDSLERHQRRRLSEERSRERVIARGSLVAARVVADEEWILATVLGFSSERNRYTVQDYDVESGERPTYVLGPRSVVYVSSDPRLGARRVRDDTRTLGTGQRVLALYPRTTVFYQCTVVLPPSLNAASPPDPHAALVFAPGVPPAPARPDPRSNPMYRVRFDDDDDKEVDVPAHLVIAIRTHSTDR
ncbi:hypothetical protein GGF46_004838 [Coemansia sp. RSA 552]|nr:hypothetical protein GGF46_004838 [Coemansia sp. RSA 552]